MTEITKELKSLNDFRSWVFISFIKFVKLLDNGFAHLLTFLDSAANPVKALSNDLKNRLQIINQKMVLLSGLDDDFGDIGISRLFLVLPLKLLIQAGLLRTLPLHLAEPLLLHAQFFNQGQQSLYEALPGSSRHFPQLAVDLILAAEYLLAIEHQLFLEPLGVTIYSV